MSDPIQSISQSNYILHNIDAKKLYVQEPLFTANSGDAVYVGWRPDETVLWSGTLESKEPQDSISLSEPATNFEKLDILYADRYNNIRDSKTVYTENLTFDNMSQSRVRLEAPFMYSTTNPLLMRCSQYKFTNTTAMTLEACGQIQTTTGGIQTTYGTTLKNQGCYIYKIVGINRKENA